MSQIIKVSKLNFLGYCVGAFPGVVEVRIPQYSNLNKFMRNNIIYNSSSINTLVLIESNDYYFIGSISKEGMTEQDTKEFIQNKETKSETPKINVNILSEINPISLCLIKSNQRFPVIHSKVYIANKRLINSFIDESSRDINERRQRYIEKINNIKQSSISTQSRRSCIKNELKRFKKGTVTTYNFAKLAQDKSIPVDLSFNTLFGRHLGIVGSTGSGKSYTAAKLIYNLACKSNSKHRYPIILLDPTGEYETLINSLINKNKSIVKFNIGVDTQIPYYDLNNNELYKLIKPSPGIQIPKLKASIKDLKYIRYESCKDENDERFKDCERIIKWSNDDNDLNRNDINNIINSKEYDKKLGYNFLLLPQQIKEECLKNKSEYQGNKDYDFCSPLTDRIKALYNNEFLSKYFCNSPYTKEKSIKFQKDLTYLQIKNYDIIYINLSNVTLANSIAEIIGDYIARKLLESFIKNTNEYGAPKHPAVLFLDEAHNFINKDNKNDDYHLHYFDLIAKEGRKYGLLMTLITQSPNDLSRDVLTQFGTFIIHHLGNDVERQKVASALPYNSNLDQYMSSLDTGEAIISSNNMYNPLLVYINKIKNSKYRPKSNTPRF